MSFREKTAWIGVISLLAITVWYFWPFLHTGQRGSALAFGRLLTAVIVVMAVQTILMIVVKAFTPQEEKVPPDERE